MTAHSRSQEIESPVLTENGPSQNGSDPAAPNFQQSGSVPSIPDLPLEIWQRVMATCVLSDVEPTTRAPLTRMVPVISLVSRTWNEALISEPSAWTRIPELRHLIHLSTKFRDPNQPFALLLMYFSRSGSLPLSWSVASSATDSPKPFATPALLTEGLVGQGLRLLVEHAERWRDVCISVTLSQLVRSLSSARGRLHALVKLQFCLAAEPVYKFHDGISLRTRPQLRPDTLEDGVAGLFADAPVLRDVHLDMFNIAQERGYENLVIELPWAQLERFSALVYKGPETHYQRLLSQGPNLRVLEYKSGYPAHEEGAQELDVQGKKPERIVMVTLPRVERLKLEAGSHRAPTGMLNTLVLPALRDLVIQGEAPHGTRSVYKEMQRLVERSGCELRRLRLQHVRPMPGELVSLLQCMSGSLEELWFSANRKEDIGCLTLDLTDPEASLVPRLKKLVLCLQDSGGLDLMDGKVIMDMINSRTRALASLSPNSDSQPALQLEQVIMLNESQALLEEQVVLCEEAEIARFIEGLPRTDGVIEDVSARDLVVLAQRTRKELADKFVVGPSVMDHLNGKRQQEMSALLGQLEELDVEGGCEVAMVLFQTGKIPCLLRDITWKPDGWIPGDPVFSFRERARKLRDQWASTPWVTAEEEKHPFNGRWRQHVGSGKAVFRWNSPTDS